MTAAFNLRKWESNSQDEMDGVDPLKRALSPVVRIDSSEPLKDVCVSCDLTSEIFQTHYTKWNHLILLFSDKAGTVNEWMTQWTVIIPRCFENDGTSESTLELHCFGGAFPKVAVCIE